MFFTGHMESVRSALRSEVSRVALFVASGVMRGAFGAGLMSALNETGYDTAFTIVGGGSTGGPAVAFLLSGNPQIGSTIYAEECCTDTFFKVSRFSNMCDIHFLSSQFRNIDHKGIYVDRVLNHKTRLMLQVADAETAEPLYVTPKTYEEFHSVLAGGAAMPGVSTDTFYYQGRRIIDAAAVDPLPIEWFMSLPLEERPTHILVIANRPYVVNSGLKGRAKIAFENTLMHTLFRKRVSPAMRKLIAHRRRVFMENAQHAVLRTDVKVAICWMPNPSEITTFERDPEVVRRTIEYARTEGIKFLTARTQ